MTTWRGRDGATALVVALILVLGSVAICSMVALAFGLGMATGSMLAEDSRPEATRVEERDSSLEALDPPRSGDLTGQDGATAVSPSGLVVEDWKRFRDSDDLLDGLSVNTAWADNQAELQLDELESEVDGNLTIEPAVRMDFEVTTGPPNDYVGFEWDLAETQDWRPFDQLEVDLEAAATAPPSVGVPGRSRTQLVVQFYEPAGEVWRYRTLLPSPDVETITIPLRDGWEWADWSASQNNKPDFDAVTRLGVFVGHDGPKSGEVAIGSIRLARAHDQ